VRIFEASAPGRCGIIGNPSDIYGGFVVSCSIPLRARCRLTLGGEHQLPEDLTLWNAATARFPIEGAVKVEWNSDVPRSSGLAGSTALLTATLLCVLAARGEIQTLWNSHYFAELVRDVEFNEAGIVCGYQDAYMAVLGGLQRMDFSPKRLLAENSQLTDFDLTAATVSLHCPLPFLLVTTGLERLSGSVHGPIADRRRRGEPEVVNAINRISRLGALGSGALVAQDWRALADAMTENHTLVASLGGSGEAIDRVIERCISNGAMAAKLAGAGLGGTVIALAEDVDALEQGLRAEGYSRFARPAIAVRAKLESVNHERPPLSYGVW
jgi:galactokinase/mevalonate kinase-like predicted kinase